MKTIFKPSLYDNPNKYYQEIEATESVIHVRSLLDTINTRALKKGCRHKTVDPTYRYVRTEKC